MSFFDNYTLQCEQCNHIQNYDSYNMIVKNLKNKRRLEVDCVKCGKRMILEFRKIPDPKHRGQILIENYYNGCKHREAINL